MIAQHPARRPAQPTKPRLGQPREIQHPPPGNPTDQANYNKPSNSTTQIKQRSDNGSEQSSAVSVARGLIPSLRTKKQRFEGWYPKCEIEQLSQGSQRDPSVTCTIRALRTQHDLNPVVINWNSASLPPCEERSGRSSHPEALLGKGVLEICSNFAGEHLCWCVSVKLLCNFIKITLRHGCSPVNLLHISRTPFHKNTFECLLLKRVIILFYAC